MPKTKAKSSRNIRRSIINEPFDIDESINENVQLTNTVGKVVSALGKSNKVSDAMLKSLEEIPRNSKEQKKQQDAVAIGLTKLIVLLEKKFQNTGPDTGKEDWKDKENSEFLKGLKITLGTVVRTKNKQNEHNPNSLKELLGLKYFGLDPKVMREKGVLGAIGSTFKEGAATLFRKGKPRTSEDEVEKLLRDERKIEAGIEHKKPAIVESTLVNEEGKVGFIEKAEASTKERKKKDSEPRPSTLNPKIMVGGPKSPYKGDLALVETQRKMSEEREAARLILETKKVNANLTHLTTTVDSIKKALVPNQKPSPNRSDRKSRAAAQYRNAKGEFAKKPEIAPTTTRSKVPEDNTEKGQVNEEHMESSNTVVNGGMNQMPSKTNPITDTDRALESRDTQTSLLENAGLVVAGKVGLAVAGLGGLGGIGWAKAKRDEALELQEIAEKHGKKQTAENDARISGNKKRYNAKVLNLQIKKGLTKEDAIKSAEKSLSLPSRESPAPKIESKVPNSTKVSAEIPDGTTASSNVTPTIINNYNQTTSNKPESPGRTAMPGIRDSDNSWIRFQNDRMTRTLV